MGKPEKRQLTPTTGASRLAALRAEILRKLAGHIRTDGLHTTAVPGVSLYRSTAPTQCGPAQYEPSLCLFVQGQKRINIGDTTYVCDESTFLLTSVDVPVVSQVVAASKAIPLLTITARLDMVVV